MAEVTPAEKVTSKRQNLEYPLNNPDEFLGRLKFSLLEEPQNLVNLVADTTASVTRAGISTAEGSTTGEDAVEETRAETMAKIDAFAGVGNQTKKGKPQMNRTGQSVKLYLPTGLAYRDTVNYDNMDIGGMGAAAEGAAMKGGSIAKSIMDGGISTVSDALKGGASGDVAKLAMIKLSAALPDEIQGALRSAGRVTTNPNTRVLFKSVNLREFAFAFRFIATSPKESKVVKDIIAFFREELYPTSINSGIGDAQISIGYKFPNKFLLEPLYNGKPIATKIKPCYLRDVSVTYNPTVSAMHSDGNFQEIEMSLMFQETRTLQRSDIKEGY
jgi:hypothetical protein|tara:strand:- start:19174 stop:20160 length:987 start_codon:yes stop_codon:yes gene_type:complete